MATAAKQVCRQARQLSSHRTQWLPTRQPSRVRQCLYQSQSQYQPVRSFSSSTTLRNAEASGGDGGSSSNSSSDMEPYFNRDFFKRLDRDDQAAYRSLTPQERKHMEVVEERLSSEFRHGSRTDRDLEDMTRSMLEELEDEFPEPMSEKPERNDGFFQMGEKEELGPDDEFEGDDISTTAHRELEQHREMREYARNAAWEMPLLAQLARPFEPPTNATPLRFRYTTYLGEQHPAAKKVVVEFDPTDLGLTPQQSDKLIKLLGPRYNPSTAIVRMSAELFESQAQNKRYLGDTIKSLIAEAKDTADTFEDLPFDFRHHKPKPKLQFPDSWLLTEDRKRQLEERRALRLAAEQSRADSVAGLINGVQEIEEARRIDETQRVEAPIMADARASQSKGKMGKKEMGQRA